MKEDTIVNQIKETVISAGTTFQPDKIEAYEKAIDKETNNKALWALKLILENAKVAERERIPLCDDTGVPHIFIEIGKNRVLSPAIMQAIRQGITEGLRALPGRPMSIDGDDLKRIDQSGGLNEDPGAVVPAPILVKEIHEDNVLRVHILLEGGGPAIRGKTQRIFHKHSVEVVVDEIVEWAIEGVSKLGCTPCTLAIGIGRSQFEATAMMMEAQVYGKHNVQNKLESEISQRVNQANIGPLSLGGKHSVLATFIKVGPQRASGVRVVSLRPNCCIEPRIASVEL